MSFLLVCLCPVHEHDLIIAELFTHTHLKFSA